MTSRHMYHPTRAIIKRARRISRTECSGTVYKVGLKDVQTDEEHMIRTCVVDADRWIPSCYAKEKTIMLVGGTGCGKSTLIDAMMNYIAGVRYTDEFRLQLVDLMHGEQSKKGQQAESQTDWLTCYTIPWMADSSVDCTVHLIDTPGFGDTRGIQRDQQLMKAIEKFFRSDNFNVNCLDAVCFVVRTNDFRLTQAQKYVFEMIQSIFDKDIVDNLFALVTFYDREEPKVLECLKAANIQISHSVCFNNSALWKMGGTEKASKFTEDFWETGRESMESFFAEVGARKSHSLKLTKEVMKERANLQAVLTGLGDRIKERSELQAILIKEQTSLASMRSDSQQLRPTFKQRVRRVKLGKGAKWATNCRNCDRTCHARCFAFTDALLGTCEVMKESHCQVCLYNCHMRDHKSCNYKLETYIEKIETTTADVKDPKDPLMNTKATTPNENKNDLYSLLKRAQKSSNRLAQIALRQTHMGEMEYIDYCIAIETFEKKEGWADRIVVLENTKELARQQEKWIKSTPV